MEELIYFFLFKKSKILYFIFKIFFLIILIFNLFINIIHNNIDKNTKNKKIPKISIFLPIYNKAIYLNRSIKSIQIQTLKDLEIIPVNDCSTDNSLEILKEMNKNDSRIKIVNNNKNYGLLYSRAMGIINSAGEYIINLDPDDEFNEPGNLEYLYNIAKKSNLDIISYASLFKYNNDLSIKCSNYHHIFRQPKLFESAFNSKNRLNDFLIWNKLIKRDILLKAYQFLKKRIYGKKWNYHEDNIWSILINKYAKSMRCSNKLVYLYYSNIDSAMLNRGNILELKNIIYRHEMYEEIFTKTKEKKYLIAEYLELLNILINFKKKYKIHQNLFSNFWSINNNITKDKI